MNILYNSKEFIREVLNLFIEIESKAVFHDDRIKYASQLSKLLTRAPEEYEKFVPLSDLTQFVFHFQGEVSFDEIFNLCKKDLNFKRSIAVVKLSHGEKTKITFEQIENALILLNKIENHIKLAFNQKIMMDQTAKKQLEEVWDVLNNHSARLQKKQEELEAKQQYIDDKNKEIDKKQKLIEERQKNSQRDFVAVLGMFTTIIFAAFGGLQLLAEVFKGLDKTPLDVVLIHGSFVFISLVIIISLMLSGVSRMSNLPIRSCNCEANDIDCECSFAAKHPTIFFSLLLVSVVTSFALVDKYFIFGKILNNAITLKEGILWSRVWILSKISLICLIPAIILILLNYLHKRVMKSLN